MRRLALLAALWLPQGEPTELQVLESLSFDDSLLPRQPRACDGDWEVGSMRAPLWARGGVVAVPGISGDALRFDGVTGHCELRQCQSSTEFTFEAWVALAAYPPAWCTIAGQWRDQRGWRVDLGPEGQLHFEVASEHGPIQRATSRAFPVGRWTHLVATCGPSPILNGYVKDPHWGLKVYVEGREVGGGWWSYHPPLLAPDEPLRIGGPSPYWFVSDLAQWPRNSAALLDPGFALAGVVDEVRIYREVMDRDEVHRRCASAAVPDPPLPERRLPDGPQGPGAFGAVVCSLPYSADWDALRDEGIAPDVVVRFDASEARFVFWGGLAHEPMWVAQDGVRAMLSPTSSIAGRCDPFPFPRRSDTPVSTARILSSHSARVVLSCRRPANLDPFAPEEAQDWIEDLWMIYPDACGARRTLAPAGGMPAWRAALRCLWEPGQNPCDLLNEDFLALSDLEGAGTFARFAEESQYRSWQVPGEDGFAIQLLNLNSATKAFLALEPWGSVDIVEPGISDLDEPPRGDVHGVKDGQEFRWAFGGGLGPYVLPGGAEFTQEADPEGCELMFGMRPEGDDVQALARGWARPPELVLASPAWRSSGWDRSQRAWLIERVEWRAELAFRIDASEASPMVRPAIVVRGWGERVVDVTIDGEPAREGVDYRQGLERQLGPTDLVVWLDRVATRPVDVEIAARE